MISINQRPNCVTGRKVKTAASAYPYSRGVALAKQMSGPLADSFTRALAYALSDPFHK